jgi:osmoprotectant transport system substrate-binding protein
MRDRSLGEIEEGPAMGTTTRRFTRAVGLLAVAVVLAACGDAISSGGGNVGGGDVGEQVNLSRATITVGSKEFTEQLILGEIAIQALENAGATVERQTGMVGTEAARDALLSGSVDLYWEYTGTGWTTLLGHEDPITDSRQLYEAVAKEDLERNSVRWLAPAPADNTYALAVRSEAAEVLGVRSLSGLAALVELRPENATLCAANEFLVRPDGLPGLQQAYGFQFPPGSITELPLEDIYGAIDKGDQCIFGEVFLTDGRMRTLGLTVLDDDKNFFPAYNPAPTVRRDVLDQHPDIAKVFAPISEKLDNETLGSLNAAVDVEGKSPHDVAQQFLRQNSLL